MQTLNQSHLDQLGQTVGANQFGIEGSQVIKMQKRFAASKKVLNLPANSIEFDHHVVAGEGDGLRDPSSPAAPQDDSLQGFSAGCKAPPFRWPYITSVINATKSCPGSVSV